MGVGKGNDSLMGDGVLQECYVLGYRGTLPPAPCFWMGCYAVTRRIGELTCYHLSVLLPCIRYQTCIQFTMAARSKEPASVGFEA